MFIVTEVVLSWAEELFYSRGGGRDQLYKNNYKAPLHKIYMYHVYDCKCIKYTVYRPTCR